MAVTAVLGAFQALPGDGYADTVRYGQVSAFGDPLNVRSGPGTSYEWIGSLPDGSFITIVGQGTASDGVTWYQIEFGNGTGYVHSGYVKIIAGAGEDQEFDAYLQSQGFPESYWDDLRLLHAMYPNWVFKAYHTNYDWNYAVDQESVVGKSLVSSNYPSSWKSLDPKAYNWDTGVWTVFDTGGWVAASREIVAYYMDPRNFLSSNSIFQFLYQGFDANLQTVAGVEQLVQGTFLANWVTDTDGTSFYYPQAIYNAGQAAGVSPYVLASMIINEMGASGGSQSISGNAPGYEGYFNYYNIGAYASGNNTAIANGLIYAMGGSNGTGTSNGRPWNTRVKAINGGAQFYAEGYVNAGQNTLYLKRFNVQGDNPFTHQYMTAVWGASSEGLSMAKGYNEEQRTSPLVFSIPVYENMPDTPCAQPTGDGSPDYRLQSLSVNGCTLTPAFDTNTTAYSVIVPYSTSSVTISATAMNGKATVTGTGTVQLNVGSNTAQVTVTAENGGQRTYTITIARAADPTGVTIDTGYQISPIKMVSGITVGTTVDGFLSNVRLTGAQAVIVSSSGGQKSGGSVVATGDQVRITLPDGTPYDTWTVLIYGDVNGDGAISNSDRIKIRNHVTGSATLSSTDFIAADVNKDGSVTNTDRIKVRNHILGTSPIAQ